MCQMPSVLQQQIKELEAVLGSGRINCFGGRKWTLMAVPGMRFALGQKELGQTQPS